MTARPAAICDECGVLMVNVVHHDATDITYACQCGHRQTETHDPIRAGLQSEWGGR